MFPIAFSIVRAQFPRDKIAIGQGIITSMYGGGAVIGLSIRGTIIQHYSWHATFFTIIPIAIVLLFMIWRFIHVDEEKVEQTRKGLQEQEQEQQETEHVETDSNSMKRRINVDFLFSFFKNKVSSLILLYIVEAFNTLPYTILLEKFLVSIDSMVYAEDCKLAVNFFLLKVIMNWTLGIH